MLLISTDAVGFSVSVVNPRRFLGKLIPSPSHYRSSLPSVQYFYPVSFTIYHSSLSNSFEFSKVFLTTLFIFFSLNLGFDIIFGFEMASSLSSLFINRNILVYSVELCNVNELLNISNLSNLHIEESFTSAFSARCYAVVKFVGNWTRQGKMKWTLCQCLWLNYCLSFEK